MRLRRPVAIAYLVCRIGDTLEDCETMPVAERQRLLAQLRDALHDPAVPFGVASAFPGGDHYHRLMRESDRVLREYRALPDGDRACVTPWAAAMFDGMAESIAQDVPAGTPRFTDFAGLERYCFHVAGTVGHLLTGLFLRHLRLTGARAERLAAIAPAFGEGLQLVNVARDSVEDLGEGRVWLPASLFRAADVAPAAYFTDETVRRSWQVLAPVHARAGHDLDLAVEYCTLLPRSAPRVRLFCLMPALFGVRTLAHLERAAADAWPTTRIRISRREVYRFTVAAALASPSNAAIHALARRAARIGAR